MDQHKCYVYRQSRDRPSKRQKVDPTGLETSLNFRKTTYREAWSSLDAQFQLAAEELNAPVLASLGDFISGPQSEPGDLYAGVISSSPGGTSTASLFSQISETIEQDKDARFVLLSSSECPNLKTLLKVLIRNATSVNEGVDEEDDVETGASFRKLLNYDLEILRAHCEAKGWKQVVVAFRDSDAFDAGVLADAITLLNLWLDRIPFKCLFGISTSVDIFSDRLPKSVLHGLNGTLFSVPHDSQVVEAVFETLMSDESTAIRFGPALAEALLQRQQDHLQSKEDLRQQLKYAYMSHFFANPLSVFLSAEATPDGLDNDHYEAVRTLSSFQKLAEKLLSENDLDQVKALLSSNNVLHDKIKEQLQLSRRRLVWITGACSLIKDMRGGLKSKTAPSLAAIYSRALAGTLKQSAIMRETLLFVKTVDSATLRGLLEKVIDKLIVMPPSTFEISPDDFGDILEDLNELIAKNPDRPLLKAVNDQGLEATISERGVGLKKRQKANATPLQSEYAQLVGNFTTRLEAYFDRALQKAEDLPFHEILIYDLKSPHRDVFTPKPRVAIERALSAPQDYLGCDCCKHTQEGLVPSQPTTAVLYQLYLESGALINSFDLWSAFNNVVGAKQPNERSTMALFFRALAELKHMGLIKQSRKRTDHLAKLAWKGL